MNRRSVGALAVGVAAALAVAAGSRVPHAAHPQEDGVVRLSWRIRGEAAAACRPLSPEELEALPVHMRNPDACRQEGLAYRLQAWIDGEPVLDRTVHPSGARGDRPIYVFEEFPVAPGPTELRVDFAPVGADPTADPDPDRAGDLAALFPFGRTVTVDPRSVVLVTLGSDADGRPRVETRSAPPR